ncbi:MAG TPA: LuxR C-terminal-related transcriptional regulator [bacterium]|nr:LuxR C-terminal-related transcriptional regulator [bacterium]
MLGSGEQSKLAGEILRESYEAITLQDLGLRILPLIDRLFDTSTSLLYRCNERRELVAIAGSLSEAHNYYAEHYISDDPMQEAQRQRNAWILHGPSCAEWKGFIDRPVHTEFATHYGVDNYISIKLNDRNMHDAGQVGIILARTAKQPDFSERERMNLSNILPALEALTRRDERWETQFRSQPFLESMLDLDDKPKIAMDSRGSLLWASERAGALLNLGGNQKRALPEALVKAGRQLGALLRKNSALPPPPSAVAVPRQGQEPIRADLRLARTPGGSAFIIAELEDPGLSPQLEELKARHQLTAAETQVLRLIAQGLSDKEIGRRLFVSMPTVHSHVTRILGKLGLSSRLQAALLARGHRL